MIVVDVNVMAYLLIEGDRSEAARQVRDRDPVWRVPPLWRYELSNVVTLYVRHRGVDLDDGLKVLDRAMSAFVPAERSCDVPLALRRAVDHRISAYDACYVALAEELGTVCVTEDRRLRDAVPQRVRLVDEFLS